MGVLLCYDFVVTWDLRTHVLGSGGYISGLSRFISLFSLKLVKRGLFLIHSLINLKELHIEQSSLHSTMYSLFYAIEIGM